MDYLVSDDGELLRDGLRQFLHGRIPSAKDRGSHAAGWKELAASGWLEAYATTLRGEPGQRVEGVAVMEAFGTVPVPGPVATLSGFVIPLLDALGQVDLVGRIRSGWVLTAPLPWLHGTGTEAWWGYDQQVVRVRTLNGVVVVDGAFDLVPGGEVADALLLCDGGFLLVVPLIGEGVRIVPGQGFDLRGSVAQVRFDGAVVSSVYEASDLGMKVHAAAVALSLFLDAEAVGGCAEVLRRTVAYACERVQFGRPIGSFQAVRHKLADMAVAMETARSLAYQAAWATGVGSQHALTEVLACRLHASVAYVQVCESAIQCHGGMGFTWEQDLHVWYRAALSARAVFTDAPALRRALSDHIRSIKCP